MTFNASGTKMYLAGGVNDTIFQYSTGTATTLDISSGTYFNYTPSANTTFTFGNAPASGTAAGFALAVTGANAGETYDIANASYDSVSFSVASQDTSPFGITFKDDGSKFYVIGNVNDTIYQYAVSTAWDVSTASFETGKTLSVSNEETSPQGVRFKSDGTSVYIVGAGSDTIYQYDLTTAWDISTGSYANKSLSVSAQEVQPRALYFKDDGSKVYIVGSISDTVHQYALSTAWDISTGSFETGKFFNVSAQAVSPKGLLFSPSGDKMYVLQGFSGSTVFEYTLSTNWDVSTASYNSISFSFASQDTSADGIEFKVDGSKMYVIGAFNDTVYQYTTGSSATATFSYPASVEWPSGTAPDGPAINETDVLIFLTDDGGTSYQGFQAGDAMS
jgi:sugar lactone lactonase YvrE